MPNERLLSLAKTELVLELDGGVEPWLWQRTERVVRMAGALADVLLPLKVVVERDALEAAALFHATGWSEQVRARQLDRWQLLARPTNDVQRELAASILQEKAAQHLPARTLRIASDAIRQSGANQTQVAEARVLGDAIGLDEVGAAYIAQQVRNYAAEGRSLSHFVQIWKRQQEYGFWELRLQNGFHFDAARQLARRRLQIVQRFVDALADEQCDEPQLRRQLGESESTGQS